MYFHGFYILSTQPLIVSFIGRYPFKLESVYRKLKQDSSFDDVAKLLQPKHVLEHIPGWAAPIYRMSQFKAKQLLHALEGRTQHVIVNADDEEVMRKRFLIRGAQLSQNIYINEHLYKPLDEHKIYDAIYTAQLASFKRHWLAKEVERLIVISYGGNLHAFCPELKHAEFNQAFIPRPELARKYNQSYAGLCLSASEGAMLAATEYLLCGIPVVSTPSKGGRDVFFTPQNSIIVPPDPESVAQAVKYWKEHPPDPEKIRQQVLDKIIDIRRAYCTYIARLIQKERGGKIDIETLMHTLFVNPNGISARFVAFKDLHNVKLEDYALDI